MIPETATGNREVVWEILIFLNSEWLFFYFYFIFYEWLYTIICCMTLAFNLTLESRRQNQNFAKYPYAN